MKRADTPLLISFASKGREDYNKAQRRNIDCAKRNFECDFLYYSLDSSILEHNGIEIHSGLPTECPSHQDVPYGFKPYLFREAYLLGYRQIMWLDSTMMVLRDLTPIFDMMKKNGVVAFHNEGHPLYKWISQKAIANTGVSLSKVTYQIMACALGFDLSHPMGKKVFKEWLALSRDGESFQNNPCLNPNYHHRHDQACLSALLWKIPFKLLPYGYLVYEAHSDGYEGRPIYLMNKGIE
jgi:hypothetical protein